MTDGYSSRGGSLHRKKERLDPIEVAKLTFRPTAITERKKKTGEGPQTHKQSKLQQPPLVGKNRTSHGRRRICGASMMQLHNQKWLRDPLAVKGGRASGGEGGPELFPIQTNLKRGLPPDGMV